MDQITMFGESQNFTPNGDYTPAFERFWAIHRCGGKRPAFRAFLKAIPTKITQAEAENFLESYLDRVDERWPAHLSTWLNGEYWEQEREMHPQNGRVVRDGSSATYY